MPGVWGETLLLLKRWLPWEVVPRVGSNHGWFMDLTQIKVVKVDYIEKLRQVRCKLPVDRSNQESTNN